MPPLARASQYASTLGAIICLWQTSLQGSSTGCAFWPRRGSPPLEGYASTSRAIIHLRQPTLGGNWWCPRPGREHSASFAQSTAAETCPYMYKPATDGHGRQRTGRMRKEKKGGHKITQRTPQHQGITKEAHGMSYLTSTTSASTRRNNQPTCKYIINPDEHEHKHKPHAPGPGRAGASNQRMQVNNSPATQRD